MLNNFRKQYVLFAKEIFEKAQCLRILQPWRKVSSMRLLKVQKSMVGHDVYIRLYIKCVYTEHKDILDTLRL